MPFGSVFESLNPRLRYLAASAQKRLRGIGGDCPCCGSPRSVLVARKYLVTSLLRCQDCRLLFRAPTTSERENARFYQREYQLGYTTTMPDTATLTSLIATRFKGSECDYRNYVGVLRSLCVEPRARVFDFGCSWGYGTWQIRDAGYQVRAFEISSPRAGYARERLQLDVEDRLENVEGECDVFFSCHALEHVPSPRVVIDLARRLLVPGGLFVAFTPNGGSQYRSREPRGWNLSWGLVHPNLLDAEYYEHAFPTEPMMLASRPYEAEALKSWARDGGRVRLHPDGGELLCAVRL